MRRIFQITLITILAVMLIFFCVILLVTKSNAIHQYAISLVNSKVPGTFSIGRLHINLFDMCVEIRDCSLSDSSGNKLVGFDRLLIDMSLLALIRRVILIENAVLEDPWIALDINSDGQLTLLSVFANNKNKSQDTVFVKSDSTSKPFNIKLINFDIINGTIIFVSQQDSINIQTYNLAIAANGESSTLSGDLKITFDSTTLKKNRETLHLHDMSLLTRLKKMDIDTLAFKVNTKNSNISINGTASSLKKDPLLNIYLNADLLLSEILSIAGMKMDINGKSKIQMHIHGNASNPDSYLGITYSGGNILGYPIQSMMLDAKLIDRIFKLNSLHVDAIAGSVDVAGDVNMKEMFPDGFLKAPGYMEKLGYDLAISGDSISLKELAPKLSGIASFSVAVNGKGVNPDSLSANFAMSANVNSLKIDTSSLPLDIALVCSTTVENGWAKINDFITSIGNTSFSLAGQYGISTGEMDAAITLAMPDLNQLSGFTGKDDVTGSAEIEMIVEGDLKNPHGSIKLNADKLSFGSLRIGNIALFTKLSQNGIASVEKLVLSNNKSSLKISGSAHILDMGELIPFDAINFDCSILSDNLNIGDFIDSVDGTVKIVTNINGSLNALQGQSKLSVNDFSASGQKISKISLDALLDKQRINIQPLNITFNPGQDLTASGWVTLKDSFEINLLSKGIELKSINALSSVDSLEGVFTVDLKAKNTYTNPQAHGNFNVDNIRVGNLRPENIGLQLHLQNQQVEIVGKAIGDVNLTHNIDTRAFSIALVFDDLLLEPYLALSGQDLSGNLSAKVSISGRTDSLAEIIGALNISNLNIDYDDLRIVKTENLNVAIENNQYSVSSFKIGFIDEGYIKGKAQGLLNGPHDINLSGIIPLTMMQYFVSDLSDIEGKIVLDAIFKGKQDNPDLSADIKMTDISMSIPGLSGRLNSLNGNIFANQNAIRIETIQGKIDEGIFSINGELKLDKLGPSDLKADILLKALPVSVPDMIDLVLDGKMLIKGSPDSTHLTGDIVLLDGLYYQDVNYQDVVINPLAGMAQRKRKESNPPVENKTPYIKNMRFDVGVQARSPFRVDNNMAQLIISPDIQLMGSILSPALNGRAKVEKGTIIYLKKTFAVERGEIDFVNPYEIEPQIDIIGSVTVRDWKIQIAISGPPDDLVFKLSCDNSGLEDQDLLSLLVIGKTTAELQGGIQALGGQTNQQMLASLVESTFGDDIKKAIGLDLLKIETGDEFNKSSDRIAVAMGKQLTKRLVTKYTIESEENVTVQRAIAEYRILQNLNIAGYQDSKGVSGGEIRLTWEKR